MPRNAHIDIPGALHHIIVRGGIERKTIFKDDADSQNRVGPSWIHDYQDPRSEKWPIFALKTIFWVSKRQEAILSMVNKQIIIIKETS